LVNIGCSAFKNTPGAARKDEAPNPWAARIRSCGKAKDLEGALQVVEEAAESNNSWRFRWDLDG